MNGALLRYRIMAYIVGVMLIVVFVSIPFQSVEKVVGFVHGMLYLLYLVTVLDLVQAGPSAVLDVRGDGLWWLGSLPGVRGGALGHPPHSATAGTPSTR